MPRSILFKSCAALCRLVAERPQKFNLSVLYRLSYPKKCNVPTQLPRPSSLHQIFNTTPLQRLNPKSRLEHVECCRLPAWAESEDRIPGLEHDTPTLNPNTSQAPAPESLENPAKKSAQRIILQGAWVWDPHVDPKPFQDSGFFFGEGLRCTCLHADALHIQASGTALYIYRFIAN